MNIQAVITFLEAQAPVYLQENYDNAGLLTGNAEWECTGIITTLDVTEAVVAEAAAQKCNLIVAHHPVIFGGLKKITGRNFAERTVISAIKNDIAIYAIHTNLDNVLQGVNGKIADKLGLVNRQVLQPKHETLRKIIFFVPASHAALVKDAVYNAGAGQIGNYTEYSFSTNGTGSFKPGTGAIPFTGTAGERIETHEIKVELVYNTWLEASVLKALIQSHPYEEPAYDIIPLQNASRFTGSGLVGEFETPFSEQDCLEMIKRQFALQLIRHTAFTGKMVKKVALCGGAGSFLTGAAVVSGAELYVTSDVKYHEFFNAEGKLLLADIGHYESEQFTVDLLYDLLTEKFPTFATLKSGINTNPVFYFR